MDGALERPWLYDVGLCVLGKREEKKKGRGEKEGEEDVGRGQGVGRCNRIKRKVVNARKGREIAFWVIGLFPV